MSINLDKVIQSLMQLISLAGIKFTGDDESLLLDALTRYHNDHSIVKSRKKADEILLADFLLALSEDTNESDTLRQAARDLYARQNAILIGLRIREARKAIGLSQTEFGKRFGKALRSIQKYESGEIEPSIATINIMARVLGVKPAELLGYPQPTLEVKTLADIATLLFDLSCKREIKFKILPIHDDDGKKVIGSGIAFEAAEEDAEWNPQVVHILRSFGGERFVAEMLSSDNPQDGRDFLEGWLMGAQLHYSSAVLTDKFTPIKNNGPRSAVKGRLPDTVRVVRAPLSPEDEEERRLALEDFLRRRNQSGDQ